MDTNPKTEAEYDTVQEALNRAEYEKRSAYGEVDGEDVLIVAYVDCLPKLDVHAGGDYEAYSDPEMTDEFVGGETVTRTFDRAGQLTTAYTALRDKYGLQEVQA